MDIPCNVYPNVTWFKDGRQLNNSEGGAVIITTVQSNSSFPETNSDVSISNFTQSDAGIYQCVFFTSTEVLASIPLRLDTGLLALVIVTYVVSMLPLWYHCYLYGVNVTSVVSMLLLWCHCYLCGVNVTSMVSLLPLWCQCYLCGVIVTCTSVVSVLPL